MATVYVHFFDQHPGCVTLPQELYESGFEIECLKGQPPDDGEALETGSKFRIECPDEAWKLMLEILKDTERSLVYSVVVKGKHGTPTVREAGEINSTVCHYTTRLNNAKHIFEFWFDESLAYQRSSIAA